MLSQITLFIFILTLIYSLKFLLGLIIGLFQTSPKPIKIGVIEKICLYLSIAYIITYIIELIL